MAELSQMCLMLQTFYRKLIFFQNEQFIEEIYSINWYNLTASQQKIVRLMLMKAQTTKQIEIAGIEELTVRTGLTVREIIIATVRHHNH